MPHSNPANHAAAGGGGAHGAHGAQASRRRLAVFPGQFDPITNGHLDVIRRGAGLFDELIVAVGINPEKRELFTLEERLRMIRSLLKDVAGVRVEKYSG